METKDVCLLQPLSLRQNSVVEGVWMLLSGMTASLNASKELERKGQVWVWKREEANCLCGLLWDPGRSFEHYKESFLFQPFQPHLQSLKDFIVFHRSWGGKAGCRRGPISSGLLWHDLWLQPLMADSDCEPRSPLFIEYVSPRGKTASCDDFMANAGKSCALHTERETFLTAAHEPHLFTLAHAHYLFIGFLSLLNAFQFWRLNHCQ